MFENVGEYLHLACGQHHFVLLKNSTKEEHLIDEHYVMPIAFWHSETR